MPGAPPSHPPDMDTDELRGTSQPRGTRRPGPGRPRTATVRVLSPEGRQREPSRTRRTGRGRQPSARDLQRRRRLGDEPGRTRQRAATGARRTRGGAWVGAVPEDDPIPPAEVDGIRLVPVRIDEQEYHGYYEGFSNAALWPLYHHALREPVLDREEWWTNYQTVNTDLADAIAKVAGRDASVWVHDYHLQLVPRLLRERRADLRIGFFLHIPFPPYELFSACRAAPRSSPGSSAPTWSASRPRRTRTNFISRAGQRPGERRPGGPVDPTTVASWPSTPSHLHRRVHAATWPPSPAVRRPPGSCAPSSATERTVILGVDRLDYSKGIDLRLRAFERLLERRPELASERRARAGRRAQPRGRAEYQNAARRRRAARRLGQRQLRPARPARRALPPRRAPLDDLVAVYLAADIMLVTPLADGMNLVAKEFAAVRRLDDRAARSSASSPEPRSR